MKNKINSGFAVILGLMLAMGFVSCEDQLSTDPENRIEPTTVADYYAVLVGGLPGMYHVFSDLMTDDISAKDYPVYNNPVYYNLWSKPFLWIDQRKSDDPSTPENGWRWYYADIYKHNLVIANVMNAEGDPVFAAHTKGEALITRAYSYFMLVNMFAKNYDAATASEDLGVPLALEALDAGNYSFARNTVQEVYDQIEADIAEGLQLINDDYLAQPKYHFNKTATYALLMRIALYKGEFERAKAYADTVLVRNPILLDHREFETSGVFEPLNHANNYFTAERENIIMIRSGFFALNNYRSGYYSNDFMRIYDNHDLRRVHNFTYTSVEYPNYITLKLSLSNEQYNFPVFRTEEALLTRAEASARLGGMENFYSAIRDVNALRVRRFNPEDYKPMYISDFKNEQDLIDFILLERRKELCYEGQRWFDLKRTGYPEIIHSFNGNDYVLEKNDPRYLMQIPDHELVTNSLMEANPR